MLKGSTERNVYTRRYLASLPESNDHRRRIRFSRASPGKGITPSLNMSPLVFCTLLLVACGALAFPQRNPGYAPNGVDYPRPIGSSNSDDDINNRFGGSTAASTPRYDSYGHEINVVNKVSSLPAEQQPFWYRNRDQISAHIGLNQGASQPTQG